MNLKEGRAKASKRLAVLRAARRLGVAAACRRAGMDRTSFYKWKARYAAQGLRGLVDRPPVHKSHPHAIAGSVKDVIRGLAQGHSAWGAGRIRRVLTQQGIRVSATTILKVIRESASREGFHREREDLTTKA